MSRPFEKLREAMTRPPSVKFTLSDLVTAYERWGCNCGPTSLAVSCGITLDRARDVLPEFLARRYTNPTMMIRALKALGVEFDWKHENIGVGLRPDWPLNGMVRIQWSGPWTRPDVPIPARYRHSHWVTVATVDGLGTLAGFPGCGVFDCNCPHWINYRDWVDTLVPHILRECEPKADGGWWVTDAIELLPADDGGAA